MKRFLISLLVIGFCLMNGQTRELTELEQQLLQAVREDKTLAQVQTEQADKKEQETAKHYQMALLEAAKTGNASQVRGLLEAGVDPNITDQHGNTPLIYAAKTSLPAVDMLLYAGADVNAKGENGITPLINSFAAGTQAKSIQQRLLKEKPDVNAIMRVPQGQLHPLVNCGTYDIFRGFNNEPKDADAPVYGSATALSFAVAMDDMEAVETLLQNGADVNVPLMHPILFTAIYSKKPNSTKMVERLLKAGANPWQGGGAGYYGNALQASQTWSDITDRTNKQTLIKTAMAPTKKQHKLDTKLYYAAQNGKAKKVKKLLAQGANPNSHYGSRYNTPLMQAMFVKGPQGIEIVKTLLDAGADPNARNCSYSTVLYCLGYETKEKTELLLKAGADVNARNMYGNVPLFNAATDAKQLLIEAGADIYARNYEGLGALFFGGSAETKAFLKEKGVVLTPYEEKRKEYENQLILQAAEQYRAEKAANANNSLGNTLLQGLVNAANDTANFAIQNAGKF